VTSRTIGYSQTPAPYKDEPVVTSAGLLSHKALFCVILEGWKRIDAE
jgi:hypothetical protein